jgi:hypothetical protein
MSGTGWTIHVDAKLDYRATSRDRVAAAFGLAADLPSVVATGCGAEMPYAMTSADPESVTCTACRAYAHQRHLALAERSAAGVPPSATGDGARSRPAADRHRDLAARFRDAAP